MVFTGASGFGFSYLLLHGGLSAMWQRYPLSVLGAYLVFLLLLRVWVEIERATFNPEDPEVLAALEEGANSPPPSPPSLFPEKRRSWLDYLDVSDFGDVGGEGCAVGILIVAAIGLIVVLVTIVAGAPMLLGEVAMDVFLVSILYRRLKVAEREHWLAAAVRKTWSHVLAAALLLAIIGFCLAILAPGADTIGEAVRHWLNR
jgi:hypothetical protein